MVISAAGTAPVVVSLYERWDLGGGGSDRGNVLFDAMIDDARGSFEQTHAR
jgi:hypothetical protein